MVLSGMNLWQLSGRQMSDHDGQIKRIAEGLSRLVELVPKTKDELDHWYDLAENFTDFHLKTVGAPHTLWHYLSDADIRMKDEVYAEMQKRQIKLVLEYLERGVMPSDEDV